MSSRERAPSNEVSDGLTQVKPQALGASPRRTGASVSEATRRGAHVSEMQRRRLSLALVEIVAEDGLDDVSIGRICKRAGVSRRTFYEVFDDREACLLAAFDAVVDRIADSVVPAYERESKWDARIRAGLSVLLDQFDSDPGLARLCVVETLRAGPEILDRRRRTLDVLTGVIDKGRVESKQGGALTPLTAQGVVGGALSVIHARLLEDSPRPLAELANQLMGMIVQPYLGPAAARREFNRPKPVTPSTTVPGVKDPFKDMPVRFTYRTALVLSAIATDPGASNRHIAKRSGITDEGQTSRLLRRLQQADLIENLGCGQPKGEPNAWTLTECGQAIHRALAG
jgi:AcrR family transcriptional regulator